MSRSFLFALAIVAASAAIPAFAAETKSSSPPPQGDNAPTQSTPIPPPQTQPQRDCERDEAIS